LKEGLTTQATKYSGVFALPLLQLKINKYYIFLVCVCSLKHPACTAHAFIAVSSMAYLVVP